MLARALFFAVLLTTLTTDVVAATFTVSTFADSGPGSLRQAILDANATPGRDQIRFAVDVVIVSTSIPDITDAVDIEGPVRITPGNESAREHAFVFAPGSAGSTLRNLRISGFTEGVAINTDRVIVENIAFAGAPALTINGGNENLVQDSQGFVATINGGARNVFLRNTRIRVSLFLATETKIGSVGNGNTIFKAGSFLSTGTIIEGNTFDGRAALVSTGAIVVTGAPASDITISRNTIIGYPKGIVLPGPPATGVLMHANSIDEVGIAIDLGNNGRTPNDPPPDADAGANNLQNYPVLASAVRTPRSIVVQGTLESVPLTTYTIELFSDYVTSRPQPVAFIDTFEVTTDETGTATFTRAVTTPLPPTHEVIVATATNQTTRDTSEVSAGAVVVTAPAATTQIPTASTWGLIAMAVGLAVVALLRR